MSEQSKEILRYGVDMFGEEYIDTKGPLVKVEDHDRVVAELKAENKMLAEALEKYANKNNWRYSSNNSSGAHDAWLDFKPDHFCKDRRELGCYTAREALRKLGVKDE